MKKVKQRHQQQRQQQPQQQQSQPEQLSQPKQPQSTSVPELSAFSLAAAIQEAQTTPRRTTQQQVKQTNNNNNPQRKIFNLPSPSNNFPSRDSHQSIATNSSFVTATESVPLKSEASTSAASSFADSSDEEDQDLNFGNDPLSVLSRSAQVQNPIKDIHTVDTVTTFRSNDVAPATEIEFSNDDPEEPEVTTPIASPIITMASKKTTTKTTTDKPVATATKTETTTTLTTKEEAPHFDVAQHTYSHVKSIWAWGKTVPIVQTFLGLSESISSTITTKIIHMDLPAIDQQVAQPNLKKLDDELVTPVILAVWKIVGPVVRKGDEMVVKPVMTEVVPRILGPLGIGKKEEKKIEGGTATTTATSTKEVKKIELKIKEQNPEYTSAPELN